MAARRRLSFAGVVSVALALSDKGVLVADPEIELIGIPDADAAGRPMADIARDAVEEAFAALPKPRRRDPERGCRSGTARCARGHCRALEQKADLPRPRAERVDGCRGALSNGQTTHIYSKIADRGSA